MNSKSRASKVSPNYLADSYKAFSKLSTQVCIFTHAMERIASGEETNPLALANEALYLAKHCKDSGFWPYFEHQTTTTVVRTFRDMKE